MRLARRIRVQFFVPGPWALRAAAARGLALRYRRTCALDETTCRSKCRQFLNALCVHCTCRSRFALQVMSREYAVGEQVNEDDLNAELATLDDQLDSIPDSAGPVDTGAAAGPVAAGGGGASAVPAGMDAELDSLGGGGGGGSKQPAWMMPMPPSGGGGGGTAARVPTAASYGR